MEKIVKILIFTVVYVCHSGMSLRAMYPGEVSLHNFVVHPPIPLQSPKIINPILHSSPSGPSGPSGRSGPSGHSPRDLSRELPAPPPPPPQAFTFEEQDATSGPGPSGVQFVNQIVPASANSIQSGDVIEDKFQQMLDIMDEMAGHEHHHVHKLKTRPVDLHENLIESHHHQVTVKGNKKKEKHHPCYRACSVNPTSRMTCAFNFTVANYYILSPHCYECPNITADCSRHGCLAADGVVRPVAVVNKMMPGPPIHVCVGDTVVVDVTNKLVGQETTIHWHGIHQRETPWMDGVPHLTQCPIHQGTKFRYVYDVPKPGTYFWHSHSGLQRADGVFGALIVRQPREVDVQSELYDFDLPEHEIIVMDWFSRLAISGHLMGHVTDEREFPSNILVNGKGFPPKYFDFQPFQGLGRPKPFVPIHEVRVRQNLAYRFRLISNGIVLCPIEVSIENHPLLVIASDGVDVMPVLVQSLVIHAGERWDFVVRADQQPGSYWMRYRGHIDCNMTKTFQLGVLNYEDVPKGSMPRHTITSWDEAGPAVGLQLNPVNVAPGIPGESITVAELSSVVDDDPQIIAQPNPDHQFYLAYDFNPVPNVNFGKPAHNKSKGQLRMERASLIHFLPQLNFISHAMPVSPPLIQPETISQIERCSAESKRADGIDCTKKHCKCTHWLKVKLNSIVEIVLVDMGIRFDAAHPFHLHGHSFRVIALERLGNTTDPEFIRQWDQQGLIPRRRANAPIKDTVYVPDGGYTIIRFRANNPGYWLFHCHIEFHAERGMSLIFQVGSQNEAPRAPAGFPTCGNYCPPL